MLDIHDLFARYCTAADIHPSATSVAEMFDTVCREFDELCFLALGTISPDDLYSLTSDDVRFITCPTDDEYQYQQSFI